jgi:hypothetical protein
VNRRGGGDVVEVANACGEIADFSFLSTLAFQHASCYLSQCSRFVARELFSETSPSDYLGSYEGTMS